jgi:hypothetical protein
MHRRGVTVVSAAVFAIGAAFAAQPTSLRADWDSGLVHQRAQWNPGAASPMSAYDPNESLLTAPR